MKKFLSLVLALVMALGCMTVTAFANNFELYVGNVQVTAGGELDHTTFPAIIDGTVTYTAAKDGNPAKLTLNNAVIEYAGSEIGTGCSDIYNTSSDSLVIELIGTSSVHASSGGAIKSSGPLTIAGSGNLNVSTAGGDGISSSGMLTFSMTGTVTATGGNWGSISANGGFTVTEGAGKIIARANANDDTYAFSRNTDHKTIVLPEGYQMVGSTDLNATDETEMKEVTWPELDPYAMIGDAKAKTVVIYNPNAKPAEEGKSGTTQITATKAEPELEYTIVIPTNVAEITAAGVHEVGQAKVENVENATDKTVISYTAETTDFKCEGKNDIPASYYTEQTATNAFPTAVIAYENKADAESIPTMWVKIAEDDWNAAEAGTYTATVTYNFEAWKAFTTIGEIMATVEDFPTGMEDFEAGKYWLNEKTSYMLNIDMEAIMSKTNPSDKLFCMNQDENYLSVSYDKVVTRNGFDYTYTDSESGATVKFNTKNRALESITISGITGEDFEDFLNGTYCSTVLFSSVISETDLPQDELSAWVNEQGAMFYKDVEDDSYIAMYNTSVNASFWVKDTTKVRKMDGNYSWSGADDTMYATFTFNMKDGKVESVTVFSSEAGADILNGTYTAPNVD